MRISFIDDEPEIFPQQYGGKARTILGLAKTLLEHSEVESVRVLSQSIQDPRDHFESDGIEFVKLDGYDAVGQIAEEAHTADVLSVHTCSLTFPVIEQPRAAIVYNLHDVMLATGDKGSHLDKALGGQWDAVVSPSEFATRALKNFAAITGAKPDIHTIPRAVDTDTFFAVPKEEAAAQLRQWGVDIHPDDGPVIFVPNRPNVGKGEDYLQGICNWLSEHYPGYTVITTFDTDQQSQTPNGVKCVGWQETEKLRYFYSVADATLCLSKLPESFSQVCTESVACGTPTLALRFGNLGQLSHTLPAVRSCDPNIDSILRQLEDVLDNTSTTRTQITASQAIIESTFNKHSITRQYLDLYSGLIAKRRDIPRFTRPTIYFASPFVSVSGSIAHLGNDTQQGITTMMISEHEAAVLRACTTARTGDEISLTTGLESETIKSIIGGLVKKRLVVGGPDGR